MAGWHHSFFPLIRSCPISAKILPRDSLISSHRKLPDLSLLLAGNPFNCLPRPSLPKGFSRTPGCNCKVCKEAFFTSVIYSPAFPNRGFTIPKPINCTSKNVVYQVTCFCGIHYVGRTSKPKPRWSTHKSHIRLQEMSCNIATHCITMHKNLMVGNDKMRTTADVKSFLTLTLIESVGENRNYSKMCGVTG